MASSSFGDAGERNAAFLCGLCEVGKAILERPVHIFRRESELLHELLYCVGKLSGFLLVQAQTGVLYTLVVHVLLLIPHEVCVALLPVRLPAGVLAYIPRSILARNIGQLE